MKKGLAEADTGIGFNMTAFFLKKKILVFKKGSHCWLWPCFGWLGPVPCVSNVK